MTDQCCAAAESDGPTSASEHALLHVAEQIEKALDDEMSRLENLDDDDIHALRKKRMAQMKEMQKRRDGWIAKGHGQYREIQSAEDFFERMKHSERIICAFTRRSTTRCQILDKHLSSLASKHFETSFCYVDVERLPGLAERFNVLMLPTVMLVENKKTFHSIIGFDEFGGCDEFRTSVVENVLCRYGMLNDRDMFSADQTRDDE